MYGREIFHDVLIAALEGLGECEIPFKTRRVVGAAKPNTHSIAWPTPRGDFLPIWLFA